MERKTITQHAAEMGYEILDADGFDRRDPELMTRLFTKEEFDKGFPQCTIRHLSDDYSLSPEAEENVLSFFRAAEASLLTKSWRQLAEEMKAISDYIGVEHEHNVKAKEETGI